LIKYTSTVESFNKLKQSFTLCSEIGTNRTWLESLLIRLVILFFTYLLKFGLFEDVCDILGSGVLLERVSVDSLDVEP